MKTPFFTANDADPSDVVYRAKIISIENANAKVEPLLEENEHLKAKVELWKDIAQKNSEAGVKYVDQQLQINKLRSLLEGARDALQIAHTTCDAEGFPITGEILTKPIKEIDAAKEIERRVDEFFSRAPGKAQIWWVTQNPLLGGLRPDYLVRQGHAAKLLRVIQNWQSGEMP
jgi:hypothetical protein